MSQENSLKIALAHDYLNQMGGAEKCLETIHELFPQAPIYTSLYNASSVDSAFREMEIHTSFLQNYWIVRRFYKFFLLFYPTAFEYFNFKDYNVVLSSSSAFAKGIITSPETCHICYCHTPMRFAWNYHAYVSREQMGLLAKHTLPSIMTLLRVWDQVTESRVDYFLANSKNVAKRIRKLYGRESAILYPPVNTEEFRPAEDETGKYFLIVSRLIPYKRIDLAIEAFNATKLPLKIIGGGRDESRLRKMAQPNVEFLGRLSDQEVKNHYAHCQALIFPGEEDFGLTSVECQSCGRPVIAYGAGGALETVEENITGLFFREQTSDSLIETLNKFKKRTFDSQKIRQSALKFDVTVFKKNLMDFVLAKSKEYQNRYL